ncbi:MAG TPA: molybdopterin dinucleotide binding domain-containing protein, partial [Chloroflexota bacterium]
QRPSLAIGGGVAGGHTNGLASLSAILALNLLTGALGREGGVRLNGGPPIEGLPIGGRATGPAEWQQLADRLRTSPVPAVLIYGADPVYSLPPSLGFGEALPRAQLVASFSSFMDETTGLADLIMPSHLPLEDWGSDVPDPGPGFPVVTIQQPVLRPFFDTRSFEDILLAVGEELGGAVRAALPWRTLEELLREDAGKLQRLGRGSVREADFERFWVKLLQQGGWWDETPAAAPAAAPAPTSPAGLAAGCPAARFAGDEREYPYNLIVFEHHALGGGELAHLPWLQATPDPITTVVWRSWVEVNPGLAGRLGLVEGDVVAVETPQGRVEVPVYVHPAAPPTVLAMPMGQGHRGHGRWAIDRGVNPIALLAPLTDEATGSLAYAATRARLVKTGRRSRLPKLEGNVPAYQVPGEHVLKVTREG